MVFEIDVLKVLEFKVWVLSEWGVVFKVYWVVVLVDLCMDWFMLLIVVGFDL